MAFIHSLTYYLPADTLDNETINRQFPEWGIDKISSKTGIYNRHIASADEFSSDMAVQVAEKLFAEQKIDKNKIQFILLCTQSADYFLPTTACIVQEKLGLSNTVGALDFNLGCSGYVYGLSLAKGLIDGGLVDNVLLITSETYSKFINPKDKSNLTIFGDAASATFLTKEKGRCSLNHFIFGTDGGGAENLIVKSGGMRFRQGKTNQVKEITDEYDNVHTDADLYMNGSEIFNFTLSSVPSLVNQVLSKANLNREDIDLYIFHQANKYMLNHLRKKIGIDEQKFFVFLENCGNTVSSTIPIALCEAMEQGKIKADQKILLAGFGVGYSWAGCTLKFY
ncbi:3-oxoacyl-ACP synthase III family protein [Pedobacter alpinus]|uniref:3-oxoacyl-ACP synthase III family protein n=1 Tax=Pedobacter alpinus TaxID=1590643 RepID=A0ABW5TSH2_9SPHI